MRVLQINHSETVTAGNSSIFYLAKTNVNPPVSVTAIPGAGTANVYTSTSLLAEVEAGTATWIAWDNGAVASATTNLLLGPVTALKFTAITDDAVFEVVT